jgi:DUF4097 and DUF4098 domain-containing protein YvlB
MKPARLPDAICVLVATGAALAVAGCAMGPTIQGHFERTFTVTGPVHLEITNASGDVSVTGGADGKVLVHADVRASGFAFSAPQERLDEVISTPPIEQKGSTIRIRGELQHLHNVAISYVIEVPRGTDVNSKLASGSQTIRDIRGPVKAVAASGFIRVENIERDVQLHTLSGVIEVNSIGDDVRASSASGAIRLSNIKGDVRMNALSGGIYISEPSGRVEAKTASGSLEVAGANSDVSAEAASGGISVQGNPGSTAFWELKTVSGIVQLAVPPSANFHLAADAVSGDIRADIPIVIEEKGRHSLRAHLGDGGGRIKVRTVSGEIRVRPS